MKRERMGDINIEISSLDPIAEEKRKKLNELALKEYDETGTLSGQKLCEAVIEFENFTEKHIDSE